MGRGAWSCSQWWGEIKMAIFLYVDVTDNKYKLYAQQGN